MPVSGWRSGTVVEVVVVVSAPGASEGAPAGWPPLGAAGAAGAAPVAPLSSVVTGSVVGGEVVVVVVVVVDVVVLVVVVAFGSKPTPVRLTEKSSPSPWLGVSLTVKLELSLNDPVEPAVVDGARAAGGQRLGLAVLRGVELVARRRTAEHVDRAEGVAAGVGQRHRSLRRAPDVDLAEVDRRRTDGNVRVDRVDGPRHPDEHRPQACRCRRHADRAPRVPPHRRSVVPTGAAVKRK
jgi:hypothetical protein